MIDEPFPTSGIPFFRGKRVCVTGATGLIGSYAVKLLKESGATVRAIGNSRERNEFTRMADQFWFHNLLFFDDARKVVRDCDIVVNCAGITGGIGIVSVDPMGYVGPATMMAMNVIEACRLEDVAQLGFLSSTTVYAPSDLPVTEGPDVYLTEPYSLYWGIGWSKRFLEKMCLYYVERANMKIAVVRPSGAYGRFDNFDESTSHVIPGMINRALSLPPGEPFEVWGGGKDLRDFVHAQDVAWGFLKAIELQTTADPINIASGQGTSTGSLATSILSAVGSSAQRVFRPDKPTALRTRLVNIGKAQRLLGFQPSIPLERGIADTVAWRRRG